MNKDKRLKLFLQFEECICKRKRGLQRYYNGKKNRKQYIHIEREVLDIDEPPADKRKKKVAELMWIPSSKFAKPKKCTLEANILLDIQKTPTHCSYLKGLKI